MITKTIPSPSSPSQSAVLLLDGSAIYGELGTRYIFILERPNTPAKGFRLVLGKSILSSKPDDVHRPPVEVSCVAMLVLVSPVGADSHVRNTKITTCLRAA